jgi:adenylate cyclase class 2
MLSDKFGNTNVEIKASCDDFEAIKTKLAGLGAKRVTSMLQRDIYYRCKGYRKKMRVITNDHTQLIVYKRDNEPNARESKYSVKKIISPIICHAMNRLRHGIDVVVDKKRELWRWKSVRIHLDKVTGLGRFIEIESLTSRDISLEEADKRCQTMIEALQLPSNSFLSHSYSDMIKAKRRKRQPKV